MKKGMSLILAFVMILGLIMGGGMPSQVWANPPVIVQSTPAPPTLTATVISSNQIDLSWGTGETVTKYELLRGDAQIYTGGNTNFSDTGLTANTPYTYKVRYFYMINDVETPSAWTTVSAVTQPAPVMLPGTPQNLSATAQSSTAINLQWVAGTGPISGYYIERKTSGGSTTTQTLTNGSATSFNDTGLTPNTTYFYRIQAYNGTGPSAYSNEANAATQAAVTVPAKPTELKSTSVTHNQIVISWRDNSDNETGFIIERKIGSGDFSKLADKSANATSHTDSSLTANTTYTYRVRATNSAGTSDPSNELPVTTSASIPAKPTELKLNSVTTNQIVISWKDNSSNETGFQIERKTGNGNFSLINTTAANATSFTNTGLTNNTVYTYRVRAVNAAGNSDYSNDVSVTTGAVPAKPESLKVTSSGTDRISLSWTDKSNNEKGFRIERKTGSGSFTEITTVSANVTNYTNTGLSNNTTYTYRIRAFNDTGNSDYSNEVTSKTGNTPAKPENLEASSVSTDRVTLTWKDRSDNEKGFKIERKTGTGSFSEITTVKANATSYTDTGLRNNTVYTYRIRAYNDDGHSEYSAELKVTTGTTPARPEELTVTATSRDRVTLSWKDRSDNESGFKIERKTGRDSFTEIATVRAGVTTYTNTGLRNETEYTYRVRAYNDTGHSSYSNEVRVTTGDVPEQPDRLAVSSVDTDRISLSWRDRSENETGFVIERKTGSGSFVQIATVRANVTSYTDTGLSSDQLYTYRVRAINESGESSPSGEISARTLRAVQPVVTRLQIGSTQYRVDGILRQMDAAPIIYENRTLLPIRYVAEAIGATVLWDAQTEKVTILMEGRTIELWIGSNLARVNGVQMQIDKGNHLVKPVIIPPGRTMMPLRFIAENLGCDVQWNEATQEVTVVYPGL